jgi:cold shock CspA family protein
VPDVRSGRVAAFDERRGLGEVVTETGERLSFHCTAIAGGSRTIAEGTPVEFDVVAGPLGSPEAGSVRPLDRSWVALEAPGATGHRGQVTRTERDRPSGPSAARSSR